MKIWLKKTPLHRSPKFRGGFSILIHYLINENTNVSNASMNMPKAIKSLKSKFLLFISITPILCKNKDQPPCNTVVPSKVYHISSLRTIIFIDTSKKTFLYFSRKNSFYTIHFQKAKCKPPHQYSFFHHIYKELATCMTCHWQFITDALATGNFSCILLYSKNWHIDPYQHASFQGGGIIEKI